MDTSYDVRVWRIETFKLKTTVTYRVRWTVERKRFGKMFQTRALAESFRAELISAARKGEPFDTSEGMPVSRLRTTMNVRWFDFACEYADLKWRGAATSRRSTAESLTAITCALLPSEAPAGCDPKAVRLALRRWAYNKKNRESIQQPAEVAAILDWVRKNSGTVSALADTDTLRRVLDSLSTLLDGSEAAPNYFNRRRAVLHNVLEYAVERGILTENPMKRIGGKWTARRKGRRVVDKRSVVNPSQAERLLDAVGSIHPSGPRLVAFFGLMYYAALRPEEAADIRKWNLRLPAAGWGEIHLDQSAPDAGRDWTDDGSIRDQRGLKHRGTGEGRTTICPPPLTELLHRHLERFGTDREGRLFRGIRGGPLDSSTYERVWAKARMRALTAEQVNSPLARRPYDLRHAAVSTWLNAGVGPAQVAEWAGHSVKVLLETYAHCLDGQEALARSRVEATLRQSLAGGNFTN